MLVHHGFSLQSGHYFCYVKNSNDAWYCMDDSSVSLAKPETVLNQEAYILFYSKTTLASSTTPSKSATQAATKPTPNGIVTSPAVTPTKSATVTTPLPNGKPVPNGTPSPAVKTAQPATAPKHTSPTASSLANMLLGMTSLPAAADSSEDEEDEVLDDDSLVKGEKTPPKPALPAEAARPFSAYQSVTPSSWAWEVAHQDPKYKFDVEAAVSGWRDRWACVIAKILLFTCSPARLLAPKGRLRQTFWVERGGPANEAG